MSIYGYLYPAMMAYLVYQALPSEWVPRRSDNLLYEWINVVFGLNFASSLTWFPVYLTNSPEGFVMSEVISLFTLATNFYMMIAADWNEVWWPEVFLVRLPFTVFAAWSTAQTIFNANTMLKSLGMKNYWELTPGQPPKAELIALPTGQESADGTVVEGGDGTTGDDGTTTTDDAEPEVKGEVVTVVSPDGIVLDVVIPEKVCPDPERGLRMGF
jgi:hypothetical protein